ESVIAKFQHAVIQNQIAELIHHFSQYDGVEETQLFEIVSEIVEQAIDPHKPHAQKLRNVLFGPTITVKALLRMRMESK
ncbi:ferric iron reductase, partial [Staphylococcus sp. GDX8P105P-2]